MRPCKSNWFFWLFSAPFLALALVFIVGGSRLLINPTGIAVTACGDVVVHRNYPLSERLGIQRPWVRYVQSISPLTPDSSGGYVCREDNSWGQRYDHDGDQGFGAWNVAHFASQCLDDPQGFLYECKWTAYLFDMIPLRPVSLRIKVPAENGQCFQAGGRDG